ncbi:hypothetical protein GF380_05195 [Candidatus Uhrbacteria bacterium]|nr:hypothetical protein [Candidatus Uhrbacteria bacterium]MBD3284427.1 hypothetical protein [Candidatus Uhrbacteria bacterium]
MRSTASRLLRAMTGPARTFGPERCEDAGFAMILAAWFGTFLAPLLRAIANTHPQALLSYACALLLIIVLVITGLTLIAQAQLYRRFPID